MDDLLSKTLNTSERMQHELARLTVVIQNGGESAAAYVAAGRIQEHANHLAPAAECYKRAFSFDNANAEARGRFAIVLLKSGKAAEALSVASQLSLEMPESKFQSLDLVPTSGLTVLADALRANRLPYSLETYEKALKIEPDDSYAAGCLAELLVGAGKLTEALELQGRIADTMNFAAIRSTLRLASNDPHKLPALVGLNHHELLAAGHV